jgi:L-alanine-DL-glutamate epimerase-like enolase superfamily enzyme
MPGFARSEGGPELNLSHELLSRIQEWVEELSWHGFNIILDLNYNFKPEGYTKIAEYLADSNLEWLEIDSYDPKSLALIRKSSSTPICSGENLVGLHQYRPFFENYSMDICSIDVIWNGFIRSLQIASLANLHEMNVTPHNYYSNLATMISAHFCASIPNFRIMEYDVDDVRWRDDLCTKVPHIEDGIMTLPTEPGWGTNINEEILRGHPRKI